VAADYEAKLEEERAAADRRQQEASREREEALKSLEAERSRNAAAGQVTFNEAIRRANEEHERKLAGLSAECERLKSELDQARNGKPATGLHSSESFKTLSSDGESPELRTLRRENEALKEQLSRSVHEAVANGAADGRISVVSSARGDRVMIVFSEKHNNYAIYVEGSVLHFLHSDCLDDLGLSKDKGGGEERKRFLTAEVVDKEFCQAKKAGNRFNVAVGTKFYRVRCKPIGK